MDRGASITARALALVAGAILVAAVASPAHATGSSSAREHHLVLVSSAAYAVGEIPKPVLRRAYLGSALVQDHISIHPLLNATDQLLYDVFLQKIMFMSHRTYERNALSQVFRFGGTRPHRSEDFEELLRELLAHPATITFMWRETALRLDGVTIVMELWHGTID